MVILGIETSCDETAAAVVRGAGPAAASAAASSCAKASEDKKAMADKKAWVGEDKLEVLSNVVSSQIEIHKKYGGVVPEVAAREHVLNILPVINEALEKADLTPPTPSFISPSGRGRTSLARRGGKQPPARGGQALCFCCRGRRRRKPRLSSLSHEGRMGEGQGEGLDAIAVTVGPGLVTSLLVGVETAKVLAYVWNLPIVAVNHIEGHIYANWLKPISIMTNDQFSNSKPCLPAGRQIQNSKSQTTNKFQFPCLILTVSGGHTMLVLMTGHGKYKTIGETRDDAAGEAFDKAAQMLNIGYPGGPAIAAEAAKFSIFNFQFSNKSKIKNKKSKISLPRPMIRDKNFDFSFSGLKTALLYALQNDKDWKKRIPEYAAEFQQAAVEVLIHKTIKAAKVFNCQTVMLAGGVAANLELRRELKQAVGEKLEKARLIIPDLAYCTDNAAMIAAAGYFRAKRQDFTPWRKLKTQANLEL